MTASKTAETASLLIEVGAGELIDKITILQIKAERILDPAKLGHIRHELAVLETARRTHLANTDALRELETALKAVNVTLWEIEDNIRDCEAKGDFGPSFVALARAVYRTNDRRAVLKKDINVLTGASIVEEKSYGSETKAADV